MIFVKVILINGSPHEKGCTFTALNEAAQQLGKNGIETQMYWIGTDPISGCLACRACTKTGKCFINDKVNEFAGIAQNADGFIFGSPVYYAGASGQLKCFMDRLFFSASKHFHNKPAAAVVSCRRGGASTAFDNINKYFMINNMPVVTSRYWNQVHGSTPEDVPKDEEGLQTMRILADNMAWLLKSIDAGRNAGVTLPEREVPIRTNFIR